MRRIEYLSPSAIKLFQEDREKYYLRYLAESRPPQDPQTPAMAVGSAFDAYVKAYLHSAIYGPGSDPNFDLESIFEQQVEPQCRDLARTDGAELFEQYRTSGALAGFLSELTASLTPPRFEFSIRGAHGSRVSQFGTVLTLLGKPDCYYTARGGADQPEIGVIHDWKVNGRYSNYKKYPHKGYVRCRNADGTSSAPHKDAFVVPRGSLRINCSHTLESVNRDWGQQLAIYGWVLGNPVGSNFVASLDQICCALGDFRVAEHRLCIGSSWQQKFFSEVQDIWDIVHSDHYFRELSREESQAKCEALDRQAISLYGEPDQEIKDLWLEMTRR